MKFSTGALTAALVASATTTSIVQNVHAFSAAVTATTNPKRSITTTTTTTASIHKRDVIPFTLSFSHTVSCRCADCSTRSMNTKLYMSTIDETATPEVTETATTAAVDDATTTTSTTAATITTTEAGDAVVEESVPTEVLAMDGVQSETEAHNAERPARKSLKKKPKGLPLTDFKVGDMIKAKAKSVTAYGAFMDIGAETDGLLHISNLSTDFVSSVKDMIEVNTEYEVRILSIDLTKKQVALSLLTEEQEAQAATNAAQAPKRDQQQQQQRPKGDRSGSSNNSSNKKDESAILQQLQEKGWDASQFVTGTVVSTVDFGAFVRVDASQLNAEVAGEFDGLVHISALAAGRTRSVSDVVKVGDVVQVRCTNIEQRKVSLTMVSEAAAAEAAEARSASGGGSSDENVPQGNKEWKADMEKLQVEMPVFTNRPLVVNNRKD